MKALWLALHFISAGAWLGCVLTEVLFERALLAHGAAERRILAQLHRRVDLVVELPAFAVLLGSGLALLPPAGLAPWLAAKIGLGALAVTANLVCVALVLRRAQAAQQGNWPLFERLDRAQHRWGALVLLGIVAAMALGVALWSGGVQAG